MTRLKFIFLLFIFSSIFTVIKVTVSPAYTEPTCVLVSGKIPIQANGVFCVTETDVVKVKIIEIGLCQSLPSAPTTSAKAGATRGNCIQFYVDSTGVGEEVSVSKTNTISLNEANILQPSIGTFSYGYMRTSNIQKVSFVKEFNGTTYSSDGTTSGTWCGTRKDTALTSIALINAGTICGTEAVVRAASGERQELIWNLCEVGVSPCNDSNGAGGAGFYTTINFSSVNNTGRSLDVYLINKTNQFLATAPSNTEQNLFWVQQLPSAITTTGNDIINISLDKSGVATIEAYDATHTGATRIVNLLTGGPVELLITVSTGEIFN